MHNGWKMITRISPRPRPITRISPRPRPTPTSTKSGVHTGAHCAHLAAAWGWCTRCAQPASMLPRSKYHARSGCHATRNHRNTGLQVKTENSNEFQFCASANVTMLQVYSSVHKKPIMFDFFIKLHS